VFLRSNDQDKDDFDPHIMGFEYSRPLSNPQASEKEDVDVEFDKYRHPIYRIQRDDTEYQLSFDLYSLAVILIELAY